MEEHRLLDYIKEAIQNIIKNNYDHHIIITQPVKDYKLLYEYLKDTYIDLLHVGWYSIGVVIPSIKIIIEMHDPTIIYYYEDKDGVIYGGNFTVVRKLELRDIPSLKNGCVTKQEKELADECINWILNQ